METALQVGWQVHAHAGGGSAPTAHFSMKCEAQNVHLLLFDAARRVIGLLKMEPAGPDLWSLGVRLAPGVYRYRYYADLGRVTTYVCPSDCSPDPPALRVDGLDAIRLIGA